MLPRALVYALAQWKSSFPDAMEGRFLRSSKTDRSQLVKAAVQLNTRTCTTIWINAFNDYNKESLVNLGKVPKKDLAPVLKTFYCDLWKKDGQKYKQPSYLAVRAALQRHLVGLDCHVNIVSTSSSRRRTPSRIVFLKKKKWNGEEEAVCHKEAISDEDWETIMEYFKDVCTSNGRVFLTPWVTNWLFVWGGCVLVECRGDVAHEICCKFCTAVGLLCSYVRCADRVIFLLSVLGTYGSLCPCILPTWPRALVSIDKARFCHDGAR